MTTKAKSTKNLRLQIGDGLGSETFTTIGEVIQAMSPSETAEQLEATSFDSTSKEYIAGLSDSGEMSFEVNFVGSNAQQQQLRTDLRAGTTRNFKIIANDHASSPTTVSFAAIIVEAPGFGGGVNAVLKGNGRLRVTGTPSWSYAPT